MAVTRMNFGTVSSILGSILANGEKFYNKGELKSHRGRRKVKHTRRIRPDLLLRANTRLEPVSLCLYIRIWPTVGERLKKQEIKMDRVPIPKSAHALPENFMIFPLTLKRLSSFSSPGPGWSYLSSPRPNPVPPSGATSFSCEAPAPVLPVDPSCGNRVRLLPLAFADVVPLAPTGSAATVSCEEPSLGPDSVLVDDANEGPLATADVPPKVGSTPGLPNENAGVVPLPDSEIPPLAGAIPPPAPALPNPDSIGALGGEAKGLNAPPPFGGSAKEKPPDVPGGLTPVGGVAKENPVFVAGSPVEGGGLEPIPNGKARGADDVLELEESIDDAQGFAIPTRGFVGEPSGRDCCEAFGVALSSTLSGFFVSPLIVVESAPRPSPLLLLMGGRPIFCLSDSGKLEGSSCGPVVLLKMLAPAVVPNGSPGSCFSDSLAFSLSLAPTLLLNPSPNPDVAPVPTLALLVKVPNNPPGLLASGVLPGQAPSGLTLEAGGLFAFSASAGDLSGLEEDKALVPNGEPAGPPVIGPKPGKPPKLFPVERVDVMLEMVVGAEGELEDAPKGGASLGTECFEDVEKPANPLLDCGVGSGGFGASEDGAGVGFAPNENAVADDGTPNENDEEAGVSAGVGAGAEVELGALVLMSVGLPLKLKPNPDPGAVEKCDGLEGSIDTALAGIEAASLGFAPKVKAPPVLPDAVPLPRLPNENGVETGAVVEGLGD